MHSFIYTDIRLFFSIYRGFMHISVKITILSILLCISLVVSLQFGSTFIPFQDIIQAAVYNTGMDSTLDAPMTNTIIWDIRLPRLLYSINRYRAVIGRSINANGNA